jgi:hypothetical protein
MGLFGTAGSLGLKGEDRGVSLKITYFYTEVDNEVLSYFLTTLQITKLVKHTYFLTSVSSQ